MTDFMQALNLIFRDLNKGNSLKSRSKTWRSMRSLNASFFFLFYILYNLEWRCDTCFFGKPLQRKRQLESPTCTSWGYRFQVGYRFKSYSNSYYSLNYSFSQKEKKATDMK